MRPFVTGLALVAGVSFSAACGAPSAQESQAEAFAPGTPAPAPAPPGGAAGAPSGGLDNDALVSPSAGGDAVQGDRPEPAAASGSVAPSGPGAPPAPPLAGAAPALGGADAAGALPGPARPEAPATPADDAIAVIERAGARYQQAGAVCADFVQELVVPLLGEKRTSRGLLCQQRPNLFTMRFTDPDGDRIVADGQYLWHYTPSTDRGQVVRIPLAAGAHGALDFHREFLENPAEKYVTRLEGQETVAGNATHRILLRPRQPSGYREAVLWIDVRSSLVRRVEIREENGSVKTITLSSIELGATPPTDAFRFTPPPGTQIFTPS